MFHSIILFLNSAMLCINGWCSPVLIGENTPGIGDYQLRRVMLADPMYRGTAFLFGDKYAIHRIWNGIPSENRPERIQSTNVEDRIISRGCINVEDLVIDYLNRYCYATQCTLIIR